MTTTQKFIVAEVSKTWINGEPMSQSPPLNRQFEMVIEVNLARGYRLHSFQFHQMMTSVADGRNDDQLVETIIAVFEHDDTPTHP